MRQKRRRRGDGGGGGERGGVGEGDIAGWAECVGGGGGRRVGRRGPVRRPRGIGGHRTITLPYLMSTDTYETTPAEGKGALRTLPSACSSPISTLDPTGNARPRDVDMV